MIDDLLYAIRRLRRASGFAFSVIVVLALGIGANAAVFTVLEATLFRPLPYKDSSRLVELSFTAKQETKVLARLPDIRVWQSSAHTVGNLTYYTTTQSYLTTQASQQKVTTVLAGANLLETLGVAPALGRFFNPTEQQSGRGNVVVLSDIVWRSQFHADPNILGRVVRINDEPTYVIGVMPAGFVFPASGSPAQIWQPQPLTPTDLTRSMAADWFNVVLRRAPHASTATVQSELNAVQQRLLPLYSGPTESMLAPAKIEVQDYRRSLNTPEQRTALLALVGAVGVLWLIACANVICLTLARAASTKRELAVRSALGASRWRLIRQSLAESVLLTAAGAALGLALSQLVIRLFKHRLAAQIDAHLQLHTDLRVLSAMLALSGLSALLLGVLPAYLASSRTLEQTLRQDGAQTGTGRHQHRMQRTLVIGEISLTLAMLVSCGLLLRTVFALRHAPLGFRTDHVFVINPNLPAYKYAKTDVNALVYKPLLERLKALPGVQVGAITTEAPLEENHMVMTLALSRSGDGKSHASSGAMISATVRAAGPELQKVLGFGMARGRYFDAQDTPDGPLVAVVNHAFAKQYVLFNGDVSKFSLSMGKTTSGNRSFKVVGIIDDLHQIGIADPAMPEIDVDAAQLRSTDGFYAMTLGMQAELLLRSSRDPRDLIPEIRHTMVSFNPDLTGAEIRTMDQVVEDAMGSQLLAAHLLETLGALALLVSLAGLYSLLTYLVALRTRELGLRLALGAQRSDLLTLILRGAGALLVAGIGVGVCISIATMRLFHSFLYGVKDNDVPTLMAASLLMMIVGLFAAWFPARRAAAVNPMEALRTE